MHRMIQIRNVPDELHRRLKARAALAGLTLSDYLLQEIRVVLAKPTIAELRERLAKRSAVQPKISSVAAIRAERDRR